MSSNNTLLGTLGLGRQTGETLYEYLERRQRELSAQLAARRSELKAMETELAHVDAARRQIGNIPSLARSQLADAAAPASISSPLAELAGISTMSIEALVQPAASAKSGPLTIKDMILKALWTGFRDTGATQAELREFIRDAYRADVSRGSMSPQVTRLSAEGLIKQKGGEDNWRLTVRGRQMFDSRES